MKTKHLFIYTLISLLMTAPLLGQDEEDQDKKPARPAFESQLLIDNQTVVIPTQGTFEWDILHRFGTVEDGFKDLYGLYDPSNIRLGFTYSLLEKLNLGFGLTKFSRFYDVNLKYLILQQTRGNSMPVSVAYYGLIGLNASDEAQDYGGFINQLSYFNELMIARRFNTKLSVQLAALHSHFNAVDRFGDDAERYDMFGAELSGRYKFASQVSAIFDITQPFTEHPGNVKNEPNYSFGIEVSTSSHAFQIFLGNYQYILPQQNLAYNPYSFDKNGLLIGFNITRLWNF